MNRPYVKKYGKIKQFTIFFVDGEYIRNNIDDAFVLAGHHLAFDYIPENEIWVEDTVKKAERMFLIVHEMFENKLMTLGIEYDPAHDLANIIEAACRKHHTEIKEILSLI